MEKQKKYFAIKGQNEESRGFDHRLCEWSGIMEVDGKTQRVSLLGEDALSAYADASENELIEDPTLIIEDAASSGLVGASLRDNKAKSKGFKKPWETEKAKKDKSEIKPEKPKVDSLTGETDKPILADCEESVDPKASKKTVIRTQKLASPKGPSLGESSPENIANMLTDDPDVFNL